MAQEKSAGGIASAVVNKSAIGHYNNKGTTNNSSMKFPTPHGNNSKQKLMNFAKSESSEVPLGPCPTLKNTQPSKYLLNF